jgi:hypothetical protein
MGVPRNDGADDRCYKHIWHRRRDDALQLMHPEHAHPLRFLARRWPLGWVLISAFIYHEQLGTALKLVNENQQRRGRKTRPDLPAPGAQGATASAASAVGKNEGRSLRAA